MVTETGGGQTDAGTWIKDHIYVPIVSGVILVALVALVFYCCCRARRRRSYYFYKRLEYDVALAEQMERERLQKQEEVRDSAYLKCQYYLRSHPGYSSITQLMDLGSRIDKHWFRVHDVKIQMDRMLSILPYNPKMMLPFSRGTSKTLKDLFSLLQHPYIFPMTDFDFILEQKYVVIVHPISMRGSLKDYIYQARFQDSWFNKYSQKKPGLTTAQVQLFGRQVLEAVLYLQEKGFPPHGSVHSGNIMVQDGACRLAGYENAFLGNTSRLFPLIKKKLKDANKDAVDVLSFGHLVFEMAFGYELDVAQPGPQYLVTAQSPAIVEVLNFIFGSTSKKYPTLQEVSANEFFAKVSLLELKRYNPVPIMLSQAMKNLQKAVRRGKPLNRNRRSSSSAIASDLVPSTPVSPSTVGAPKSTVPPPPTPPPPGPAISPTSPPPAPGPPGLLAPPQSSSLAGGDRGALLSSIRQGAKLKKTLTNDRSAPKV